MDPLSHRRRLCDNEDLEHDWFSGDDRKAMVRLCGPYLKRTGHDDLFYMALQSGHWQQAQSKDCEQEETVLNDGEQGPQKMETSVGPPFEVESTVCSPFKLWRRTKRTQFCGRSSIQTGLSMLRTFGGPVLGWK